MEITTWEEFFEGLSQRAKTALRAQGVGSFDSLEAYRFSDLLRLSQLGKTTANEISAKLARIGRSLAAPQGIRPSASEREMADLFGIATDTIKEARKLRAVMESVRLTLPMRDLFAMAALVGLLSNGEFEGGLNKHAEEAYYFADAMMEARGQKKQEVGCA